MFWLAALVAAATGHWGWALLALILGALTAPGRGWPEAYDDD